MDKILQELQSSREQVTQDRNAIAKARKELEDADSKVKALQTQNVAVAKKMEETSKMIAERKFDLICLTTREEVMGSSYAKLQKEKERMQKALNAKKKQYFDLIRSDLASSSEFAMRYSCSTMGSEIRSCDRSIREDELVNELSSLESYIQILQKENTAPPKVHQVLAKPLPTPCPPPPPSKSFHTTQTVAIQCSPGITTQDVQDSESSEGYTCPQGPQQPEMSATFPSAKKRFKFKKKD